MNEKISNKKITDEEILSAKGGEFCNEEYLAYREEKRGVSYNFLV